MNYDAILKIGRRREKCRPLPVPTRALPGTPEKVEVLVARRRSGLQLWHPADAMDAFDLARSNVVCGNGAKPLGMAKIIAQRGAAA